MAGTQYIDCIWAGEFSDLTNNILPRLYGHTPSQPTRTVIWLMLMKGLPFELRYSFDPTIWGKEIKALNVKGQAPALQDGDFVIYEMPAIIAYLCEKHGWHDLFPQDLQTNSLIQQYFHFHHTSIRVMTMKMMAPHVAKPFIGKIPIPDRPGDILQSGVMMSAIYDEDKLTNGAIEVEKAATILEHSFFRGNSRFVCGDHLTVADLAAYGELGQLQYAKLFDFSKFEKIATWIKEMKKLPYYDEVHEYNRVLGDINNRDNTAFNFLRGFYKAGRVLKKNGVKIDYTYFDIGSFIARKLGRE